MCSPLHQSLLPLLLSALLLGACQIEARTGSGYGDPIERDLAAIVDRDTLSVLLPTNSTSYFVYRGEPMGFEYELLRAFAREHDLALDIRVVVDPDSLFPMLLAGHGDIAGGRLVPTAHTDAPVQFTEALYRTQPTVVQSEGAPDIPEVVEDVLDEGAEAVGVEGGLERPGPDLIPAQIPEEVTLQARRIRQPADLAGETVILEEGSPIAVPSSSSPTPLPETSTWSR
jgi:membrane-bound lytic murein transglycosylase F